MRVVMQKLPTHQGDGVRSEMHTPPFTVSPYQIVTGTADYSVVCHNEEQLIH